MFTQALGTGADPPDGFESEFRFLADIQGLTTVVGRHPSASLLPIFNDTYRSLREQVTEWGYTQFLNRGNTTALPTVPFETGESYATIATVQGLDQVKSIDVKTVNGRWRKLDEGTILQLRDGCPAVGERGCPRMWCWLDAGTVSGATYTGGHIAISPTPTGGSYVLWSMQEFTPIAVSTDVFLYHTADWKQWHQLTALVRVCGLRDKDTAAKLNTALRELDSTRDDTVAGRIKNQAPTAAGPKTWTRSNDYRGGGAWGS